MTQSKVGEPFSKFVKKNALVELKSIVLLVGEKLRRHVIRIPEPHILDFLLDMYVTLNKSFHLSETQLYPHL